jgi:hypothetical protein
LFWILATGKVNSQSFFSTRGTQILDGNGNNFVMRGINLGNWLLPEGYFFKFKNSTTPRQIESAFNELIGPQSAASFWKIYLQRFIAKADIDFVKNIGANSIRIPFHYKLFTNESYLGSQGEKRGFDLLDTVLDWCRINNLYVVLDMHAAPCGQTGDNIDDSYGYPFLFENENCMQTVAIIWKKIAAHYKNEKIIIGYDLLNEPIAHYFNKEKLNVLLEPLYRRITDSIRKVDTNHIIFLGGAQWNSDFSPFSRPFDKKLVYTFHKYWTSPSVDVILDYIKFRNQFQVPIYCGETGENSNEWMSTFRGVLDSCGIGWHVWPYKKMDANASIVFFDAPAEFSSLRMYADTARLNLADVRKLRSTVPDAEKILEQIIRNCSLENCHWNVDFIQSLGFKTPNY